MSYRINSYPGRVIIIDQKEQLYFGGTSYLGMQDDEDFKKLFCTNVLKYGTNYGASRESNIRIGVYEEAEASLAQWVGSEACISLSSGYLAGQLVRTHFNTSEYTLFYGPNAHTALQSNNAKLYSSFSSLVSAIKEHLQSKKEIPVILLDTIDYIANTYPNGGFLQDLPLEECILVADDSHGIGVLSDEGSGAFKSLLSLNPKELLVCCSLGKAMALQAGAIFTNKANAKALRSSNFYSGASPSAPAYLATYLQAGDLYNAKRKKLEKNMDLFSETVTDLTPFNRIPGHPVFGFNNPSMIAYLKAHNVVISNFEYDSDQNDHPSRIVLSAAHTSRDILKLSDLINGFCN
jgi:7-keto-8-aminopelargonate synthetase-like enzyme